MFIRLVLPCRPNSNSAKSWPRSRRKLKHLRCELFCTYQCICLPAIVDMCVGWGRVTLLLISGATENRYHINTALPRGFVRNFAIVTDFHWPFFSSVFGRLFCRCFRRISELENRNTELLTERNYLQQELRDQMRRSDSKRSSKRGGCLFLFQTGGVHRWRRVF